MLRASRAAYSKYVRNEGQLMRPRQSDSLLLNEPLICNERGCLGEYELCSKLDGALAVKGECLLCLIRTSET